MGVAGHRKPRSEAVTVPDWIPLTRWNVLEQRVAGLRAQFGTKNGLHPVITQRWVLASGHRRRSALN
jgi:hypothetical protein